MFSYSDCTVLSLAITSHLCQHSTFIYSFVLGTELRRSGLQPCPLAPLPQRSHRVGLLICSSSAQVRLESFRWWGEIDGKMRICWMDHGRIRSVLTGIGMKKVWTMFLTSFRRLTTAIFPLSFMINFFLLGIDRFYMDSFVADSVRLRLPTGPYIL